MEGGLVAGVVALQAVELLFAIGVKERVDTGLSHLDLPELDTVEGPGVAEEVLEERLLEGSFGADLGEEFRFQALEVGLLTGHYDDVFGCETVLERVHSRNGFAFWGARSGLEGFLCTHWLPPEMEMDRVGGLSYFHLIRWFFGNWRIWGGGIARKGKIKLLRL